MGLSSGVLLQDARPCEEGDREPSPGQDVHRHHPGHEPETADDHQNRADGAKRRALHVIGRSVDTDQRSDEEGEHLAQLQRVLPSPL